MELILLFWGQTYVFRRFVSFTNPHAMASLTPQEQTLLRELSRLAGSDRVVSGRELRDAAFADFVASVYGSAVSYPQSLQSRKLQTLRDKGYVRMERHAGGTYTILEQPDTH